MKYRKLAEGGDYMFGRREQFHEGRYAVAQAIKTRLLLLQGEWWEGLEDGLPLFQEVVSTFHAPDRHSEIIDLIFSERILETEGVESLLSFESELDPAARTYSAHCLVETAFGEKFSIKIVGSGQGSLIVVL